MRCMTKISRSKIDLFVKCPQCFWLDLRHGVKQPPPAPYTINSAIDYLLKQEFDRYRAKGEPHPIMVANGVDAIPYRSPDLDKWRHNFTGVQHHHRPTDFFVFGAVDDVWINPKGELIVVDYKATGANAHKIHESYPRQMEIYQWLLRENGYPVSPTGYFVFARVNKANGFGDGQAVLPFDIFLEPLAGDPSWIPDALAKAKTVLENPLPPSANPDCEYCRYREGAYKAVETAGPRKPRAAKETTLGI